MDCRNFRNQHVEYVDDTVSGFDLIRMQRHVSECPECAAHDARVRRGLLLVRNLPAIEPSAEFRARLLAAISRIPPFSVEPSVIARLTLPRLAAAAAILVAGWYAADGLLGGSGELASLSPVVASLPEPAPSPLGSPMVASPAIVASYSAGLPVWPAALFAEQAPVYFANAAYQTSLTR